VSAPPSFELRNVVAGPVGAPILRNVTVDIPCQGITALAGPSGSGKSTLLRLLNRLDDPIEGTIDLDGEPLVALEPSALRRRVGMVFQKPPIFEGDVFDNLRVADSTVTETRAVHVLEHVGLSPDLLSRRAADLSGGEAQRMCVARALLTDPSVLLADEPTAALDRTARRTIEDLGLEVAADGVPIVWVTHDTEQLRRLADHAMILIDGHVVAFGHVDELSEHPDPAVRRSVGVD
jgi:putative ABC transport system ATP-binding protein